MCPGCCPGIGMGVTPTMNTHKGNMGIAVPCSRREHRAILPEPSSFREPGALWANRTVETARLVYKSNRIAISTQMLRIMVHGSRVDIKLAWLPPTPLRLRMHSCAWYAVQMYSLVCVKLQC